MITAEQYRALLALASADTRLMRRYPKLKVELETQAEIAVTDAQWAQMDEERRVAISTDDAINHAAHIWRG